MRKRPTKLPARVAEPLDERLLYAIRPLWVHDIITDHGRDRAMEQLGKRWSQATNNEPDNKGGDDA